MDGRRRENPELKDWLREGLDPGSDAAQRVSARALSTEKRWPGKSGRVGRLVVAAAALAGAFLLWVRLAREEPSPAAPPPIRIANQGELLTVIDPAGATWLHTPTVPIADSSPRLIILLGGNDAN